MTTIYDVVRQICLSFQEAEEKLSHGFPNFHVRGKTFATYTVNHHGDGKVALLVSGSKEQQTMLVDSAPTIFFIPPYVGHRGWIGIELNQGLSWSRVAQLTHDAYVSLAPKALYTQAEVPEVSPPTKSMSPSDINPLLLPANQKILKKLRELCLALPETQEAPQFGNPAFKAGKKTFCSVHCKEGALGLEVWTGLEQQASLTAGDARYRVPAYSGQNGWTELDLSGKQDWQEIRALILHSYRHFALQRMLKALQDEQQLT